MDSQWLGVALSVCLSVCVSPARLVFSFVFDWRPVGVRKGRTYPSFQKQVTQTARSLANCGTVTAFKSFLSSSNFSCSKAMCLPRLQMIIHNAMQVWNYDGRWANFEKDWNYIRQFIREYISVSLSGIVRDVSNLINPSVKQIRFFFGSIADAFQLKRFSLDHWSVRPSMASVRRATRRVALPLRHVQNTTWIEACQPDQGRLKREAEEHSLQTPQTSIVTRDPSNRIPSHTVTSHS